MAEAMLRHVGGERFAAFSAGTQPALMIHPLAVEAMRRLGVSMEGQYSKGWEALEGVDLDVIITVCDAAAMTPCPAYLGKRRPTAHWSLPDPSHFGGAENQRQALADFVAERLKLAIEKLVQLPLDSLTPEQLRDELMRITPETGGFRPPRPQ